MPSGMNLMLNAMPSTGSTRPFPAFFIGTRCLHPRRLSIGDRRRSAAAIFGIVLIPLFFIAAQRMRKWPKDTASK
jgi:hypothetical protein